MIERKILKDIRKVNTQFVGPLGKRETLWTAIAVVIIGAERYGFSCLKAPIFPGTNMSEVKNVLYIFEATVCILLGYVSVNGLPFEKWFTNIFLRYLDPKAKIRPYKCENTWRVLAETCNDSGVLLSNKEQKKKDKEQKKYDKLCQKRKKGFFKKAWKPKTKGKNYDCYL